MNKEITHSLKTEVKILADENYIKIQFFGRRSLDEVVNKWHDVTKSVQSTTRKILIKDKMFGQLSVEEIGFLIESIQETKKYAQAQIAIVLRDGSSYNHRFFDIVSKYSRLNIKHFTMEDEAMEWLTRK